MNSVKSSIDILKRAQELDRKIYQAGVRLLEDIPEEKLQLKQSLENERVHLKSLEDALKKKQLSQKEKEGALAQKEANIKKIEGQLGQVKTNKEYSALQQEIAALKADNSLLEEEIIKSFDEVESADKLVKQERERLKNIEKEYSARDAELAKSEAEAKNVAEQFKKERSDILSQVEPDVRAKYDLIVQKKQGVALVKINGEICSACQIQVRPQLINEVRLALALVLCENCSRILYFED